MILEFFLYKNTEKRIKHIRIFTYFDSMASATQTLRYLYGWNWFVFSFTVAVVVRERRKKRSDTEDRLRRLVRFKPKVVMDFQRKKKKQTQQHHRERKKIVEKLQVDKITHLHSVCVSVI